MEPAQNPTENNVVNRVDRGLELAVRDLGLPWEDEGRRTKREKYRFIAMDAICDELPVTFSWFEYGASALAGKGYVSESMSIPNPESYEILHMEANEVANFFQNDIEHLSLQDWWTEPLLEFLEYFYELYCPPHLQEIYLANIQIRKVLENRVIDRINTSGTGVPQEDFKDLQHELRRIQTELASDTQEPAFDDLTLRDLYDDFLSYSDLLQDAVLAATRREEIEAIGPEFGAIMNLKSVFDDTVWPLITSIISYRTPRGPNPEKIEDKAEGKYYRVARSYNNEINGARRQCHESDLIAGIEDFPIEEDSISNKVDELMEVIDGNHDGNHDR